MNPETDNRKQHDMNEVIDVCMLAGKLMLQNGAETYRVEDTMARIAGAFGMSEAHSYVTPTAVLFSIEGAERTRLARVSDRTIRLDKVTQVNGISRNIASGDLTLEEARELLKQVESDRKSYPLWISSVTAGIASGCFLIMFGGIWADFLPATVAGSLGYVTLIQAQRYTHIKFFSEFTASLLIGLLAALFVKAGAGMQFDKIVIGSVMPLVPGLLITNAVRDLIAGHLVSGLSKGAEAFLTAFAIGAGIAVVLNWFG
ncbi:threonine/serine exporter family protein [Paenibacillus thermotolerans]|uniref:threonine/serine exporter family protein n=1 Tax=Paenibacillus thermotolerans TaxID=3027807 RepID=UPI00236851FF|nr:MULTISPECIES: threonine/serine exporter family protein [unclassified Paenibacillus]